MSASVGEAELGPDEDGELLAVLLGQVSLSSVIWTGLPGVLR